MKRVKPAMVRVAALTLGIGVFTVAVAMPPFWDTFTAHYQPPKESALFKAECVTCHAAAGPPQRNPYGRDLGVAMHGAGGHDNLTIAMLRTIELKDSDGDGAANIEEIRAGTLPGDPASKPKRALETRPPSGASPTPEPASAPQDAIPRHSFHPLVVHFPIGIFLFGVFLEVVGKVRRNPPLRTLALWNLAFGALASLLAIPTGIAAWLRLGFPLEGTLLTHFVVGIVASALMSGIALWRRNGPRDGWAYWTVLGIAAGSLAIAGHFGALMVYG